MTESNNLCSVMFLTLQTVSTMLDVFFLWPYYLVFLKMILQCVQSLFVNLCPLEFVGEYLCSSTDCFYQAQ